MPITPLFQSGHPVRQDLEASGVRFVKCLGRGGFSEAWEVERDQARQCLKISNLPLDGERGLTAVELEALKIYTNPQIATHAFIVNYFGQRIVGGHLATFWELGLRTLLDLLEEERTRENRDGLTWQQLVGDPNTRGGYLWSVAQATDDFNHLGHQHRDIKPANLFLFYGNQVKLGDLGLATRVGLSTHHSQHKVGTDGYRPPEAMKGQWNKTSDLFSFAATYITLRTGREPFGDEFSEQYERQQRGAPIIDGLEAFERAPLLQALAPRPVDRPQGGIMAFLRALQPGRGHPSTPALPFVKPADVQVIAVPVPPVDLLVEPVRFTTPETPGLPAIPPETLAMTGQALGCDQAIEELKSGSHPALRAGVMAVRQAEQQAAEREADLQAHQPKLSAAVCQKIADAVAKNPGGSVHPLLRLDPKADPDELLEYIQRVRNLHLANQFKQQTQAEFERGRKREIDKLVALRKQLSDKLADWQRTDLGEVVEALRRRVRNSQPFPLSDFRAILPALLTRYGKGKKETASLLERAEHLYRFGNRRRHTNKIGMEFEEIVEGEFLRGSPDAVGEDNERPQRLIRITRPLLFGKYPVTVGQFRKFVQATGYSACGDNWQKPGFAQTDNHPVVCVSYEDALAMAAWLTDTEGERYTLATEAEWEYACRSGTTTLHYGGDDLAWLRTHANVAQMHSGTTPVGRFPANPWGLHDMLGNCWEWVADWWAPDYYRNSPSDDPTGPTNGQYRVVRGGSWYFEEKHCRSGCRFLYVVSPRFDDGGFRLCIRVV